MMRLSFSQKMLLANVNVRAEIHGADVEPAVDLKLTGDFANEVLDNFCPGAKLRYYHYDEGVEHDLADQGKKADGFAPDLRDKHLRMPLEWEHEMVGAAVHIVSPGEAEVLLDPVKVNEFSAKLREGGTVSLTIRVQGHPDKKAFGELCTLKAKEVEVKLTPAEEVDPSN